MTRYRGFFGRVRANFLIEKALKFGIERYGIHLRISVDSTVRKAIREHLEQPNIRQNQEEVFFLLCAAYLPVIDHMTRYRLSMDMHDYHERNLVSTEVYNHLLNEADQVSPDEVENARRFMEDVLRR